MDDNSPKTLYVGNLDHSVSEDLLVALFSQMGPVKGCKIIREAGNDPYAFIDFINHQAASTALTAMNKRLFLDKEIKVNWASSPSNQPKTDTSAHHHIFVGDLSPEIETETLREAFAPFGEISNCRIVRDTHTMKSRGYAFVSFVKRAEAENAIQAMNGQWLGTRSIRTNWSTRKPPTPRGGLIDGGGNNNGAHLMQLTANGQPLNGPGGVVLGVAGIGPHGGPAGPLGQLVGVPLGGTGKMNGPGMPGGPKNDRRPIYDEVYNQTSATNTTVYCGSFPSNTISEELMHKHFGLFGSIHDVRVFKDKGYAFVKFTTKEAAAHAIEHMHNTEINGHPVKCFWGKVNGGAGGGDLAQQQQLGAHVMAHAAAVAAAGGLMGAPVGPAGGPGGAMGANASLAAQIQQQHQNAQYPYSYGQLAAGYWYQPAYPAAAQIPAQYMQQHGYPAYSAYTTYSPQQGYRMVPQPNGSWGVQATGMPAGLPNGAAGQPQPQMMYATTPMQQYQAQ